MLRNNMTELKNRIWKLFGILRSDLRTEDYSIILLLIYLRSKNLISKQLLGEIQPKSLLIHILNEEKDVSIKSLYDVFLPLIKKLSEKSMNLVVNLLSSIDSEWLNQNIIEVYDETLERIILLQGGRIGDFIQPNQLTVFINSYIETSKDIRIYNPFAGVASFIKDNKEANSIYAQEVNQKTWAMGQLRLIINQSTADLKCEDSIMNWPINEKFDLIVSNPPYGMQLNRHHRQLYPKSRTFEDFLMSVGVDSLSDKGKLASVLSSGILYRGGIEKKLRERLIQNDLIDTIISFPGGLLYNTGIPFVVIILNKSKRYPSKIKLVDAHSFVSKRSARESILDVENLLSAAKNKDSKTVKFISNNDVIDNDYNLNLPRYFQEEIEGVELKEILSYHIGKRGEIPEIGKVIRIRNLKDDSIDFHLSDDKLEETPITSQVLHKIDTSCLLLAVRWKTLKPTFFNFTNEAVYKSSDILSFKVDLAIVDVAYLVNELQSKYVQQQLEGFRQGATIPFIKKDDLLKVKIELPSIAEQRAKISGLKEISNKIKQLQSERNALAHGIKIKEFNEFASLKHSLGTPTQNILSNAKSLIRFFENNNSDAFDEVKKTYNIHYKVNLVADLVQIKNDVNRISTILEKGENGLILENYKLEAISIDEIDKTLSNYRKVRAKYKPQYKTLPKPEKAGRAIEVNMTLFKVLIDNILSNADKYAFSSKEITNQLIIELKATDDYLELNIRNNGIPFPNNFDKEKFITKFKTTSGTGLGGYDINRITTYFKNPEWELELKKEDVFPVVFKFSFPIIPMINE